MLLPISVSLSILRAWKGGQHGEGPKHTVSLGSSKQTLSQHLPTL